MQVLPGLMLALLTTVVHWNALGQEPGQRTSMGPDQRSDQGLPLALGKDWENTTDGGCGPTDRRSFGTLSLRHENDLFGDQDQGYTSGFLLDWTSEPLDRFDEACLATVVRAASRTLAWAAPGNVRNGTVGTYLGQALYTPRNAFRRDLIAEDRPYVALLLAGFSYSTRTGTSLVRNDVQLGLVGPAVQGQASQDLIHGVIGAVRFQGWSNQLRSEPVFGLVQNRFRRWRVGKRASVERPQADLIVNWGARVGNLFTWANAGLEFRFGTRLPDDFGSSPVRPGAPEGPPAARPNGDGVNLVGFVAAGARLILRDLTLDGSTFQSSHRVERRPLVSDLGYGVAISSGPWQFAFGRFHRSREFDGQRGRPIYGSITISRRF